MTSATPVALDPRLAAFCDPDAPEVFHAVASAAELWRADPYDVPTIHAEAREAFERLLHRAGRLPPPPTGAALLLLGESGSGKTHLLRAFRTRAHAANLGYCGYMPMTTEVGNYAGYILQKLLDGLEEPYCLATGERTGLARLSAGLFERVPGLADEDRRRFREGEADDPAALVYRSADALKDQDRFARCDLDLLRALLHLQRPDSRVKNRVLMWLRCRDLAPADRALIGDLVPRPRDEDALEMIVQLARLTEAVHGVPLVLLIDQLEDVANLAMPEERFRRIMDAVAALTDQVPTAVVVIACLEDYYAKFKGSLIRAKLDRLERDPEPIRLASPRSLDDIRAMTARRLEHLYAEADVDVPDGDELYPFRPEHLTPLANLRARDVLDNLRRHHERCIVKRCWSEPVFGREREEEDNKEDETQKVGELSALWNDFLTAFKESPPDNEEDLAALMAWAVRACSDELPDGCHIGAGEPNGRVIDVDIHRPDKAVDKLLVAVCNKSPRGGGLGKQITELEKLAGEIPVAIVRTTDFPGPTALVSKQIARMLKKDGRRVVVPNADWRRMLALQAFRERYGGRPDYRAWACADRPLSTLKSMQDVLRLPELLALKPQTVTPVAPPSPPPTPEPAPAPPAATGRLLVGRSTGALAEPVELDPDALTTHAAFLGGSGSGKTTAALNLIEQLLLQGVPAVLVDRKGDLCSYADPLAWQQPLPDPARAARRQELRDRLDVAVYTPGETRGRPLALPLVPPGFAELPEADREQYAQFAAAALGSMMDFKARDADRSQLAVLTQAIGVLARAPGTELTLAALRKLVEDRDDALLTAVGGYNDRVYAKLAERLLTLTHTHKALLSGGELLDVDALLGVGPHARPGRVRLSVVSTRFLGDATRADFFVAQLLLSVGRWCARRPSNRLQTVLLFDEADKYLPATRQPATKGPMEDLLRRARSAGVGIFLATQSPGDFDYKCRDNVATWLIGRVREARALEKVRTLLAARPVAPERLAGQAPGQFHLATERGVTALRSEASLVRAEQLPEARILELARAGRAGAG